MTSMGGTNIFGWMEKPLRPGRCPLPHGARAEQRGLLLPGCQPVYNPIGGQWLNQNRTTMYEELKPFMEELHATGAKMFVQLTAGF